MMIGNTKVIATIIRGIDGKKLSVGYRKAQLEQLSQVMAVKELKSLVGPTVFVRTTYVYFKPPHNSALVVQLNIAMVMVH